jgi:hypothetical protein
MQYWDYSSRSGWAIRTRGITGSVCPRCRSTLYLIPSRLVDRFSGFLSRFKLLRYQCELQSCGWEGNLPVEGACS